jgi:exopolysaccharide production protein ExoQ
MTASWDSPGPAGARPRRIRGGEIPTPSGVTWREQQRLARAAARTHARPAGEQRGLAFRFAGIGIDADALFAFGFFLPMAFQVQWATRGAAVIVGLTPLYLFVRRKQLGRVLAPRAFLFAFPALALLSTVWSDTPTETLRYAVELCITVTAALLLSSARDQRAVLRAITLAFLIYVAEALRAGGRVTIGVGAGGEAFSGLTDSKNLMADIAATGLIVSAATAIMSVRDRKWIWVAIATTAILLEVRAVVAARSAGAFLGLAMGLTPLLVLSPMVAGGKALRGWLTSVVAIVLIVVGLNFRIITQTLINVGVSVFDKDPTLTGRTYLWYRAFDLIRQKPSLGSGYFSFWLQGNIDAEGLWRYAGIGSRGGFSFHNTLVDLLVTVGWVGAGVLMLTVAIGAVALVRRFVMRPSMPLVFWISILLYELSRTPFETLGFQPFAITTTLVFGALGAAFGPAPAPRPPRPARAAEPVRVWPVNYAGEAWANPRLRPLKGSLRVLHEDETSE